MIIGKSMMKTFSMNAENLSQAVKGENKKAGGSGRGLCTILEKGCRPLSPYTVCKACSQEEKRRHALCNL